MMIDDYDMFKCCCDDNDDDVADDDDVVNDDDVVDDDDVVNDDDVVDDDVVDDYDVVVVEGCNDWKKKIYISKTLITRHLSVPLKSTICTCQLLGYYKDFKDCLEIFE